MGYLNQVTLMGNLGKDPEVRSTVSGNQVANFSIATTEKWTDKSGQRQEKTEWHNIVVWGRMAETVGQYLKKGSAVLVVGKLQTRSWEGQDGNKRYATEVVASNIQFVGGGRRESEPATNQSQANTAIDDSELPF